nr:Hypothetical predicted protein [Ipomoea batatas]
MASLSRRTATSVCSRREWVDRTLLYGSTTEVETWGEGIEDEKSLKTSAVVSKFTDPIQAKLLRVKQLSVWSGPHLINDSGFQINKHSTRNVLSSSSFTEEGVECIITSSNSLVGGHLAIRLWKTYDTNSFSNKHSIQASLQIYLINNQFGVVGDHHMQYTTKLQI